MAARSPFARLFDLHAHSKDHKHRKLFNSRRRHFEMLESRQMLAIDAANIVVQQNSTANDAAAVTLSATQATPDFGFTAGQLNTSRGDFAVRIGAVETDDADNGVLMTTISENGRTNVGDTLAGTRYGVSSIARSNNGWRVSANDSAVANTELNINVAAAYFPVADFPLQGSVTTVGGTAIVGGTLSLGVNPQTDGVLLVNAESADSRYAQSLPLDATTWNIWHHDGAVNGDAYSAGTVRYVYLPYTTPTTTAILGRVISGNPNTANPTITSGQAGNGASIVRTATGQFTFSIAGQSPSTGVLLLSMENTGDYNDNIVSYQASGNSWNIEVRDQPASPPPLRDHGTANAPMFSFVFIPTVSGALPPVAVNDTVTINQDTPVTISVLSNDSDPNGDAFSIVSATQSTNGTTLVNGDGTITFNPTAGFSGNATFTYTIQDAPNTGTSTATVNITVRPNTPPVAVTDTQNVPYETATVISVVGNDTDINGGTLTVTAVGAARHGQLTLINGVITYTPAANYFGPDSFTYTVRDDTNLTSVGTVNITVILPTITFQQGVNGYAGTVDTVVRNDQADTNNSGTSPIVVDLSPNAHALLRFDNIFGSGAGQIPSNAVIASAKVSFFVTNEGTALTFHRMLQTWSDAATWNTTAQAPFNSTQGLQADGVEAAATADLVSAAVTPTLNVFYDFDVTNSLRTWLADPAQNFGWAIVPPATDNSVQWISAEGTTISQRPILTVTLADRPLSPTLVDDTVSVIQNTPLSINVLANDSDVNGGPLTVTGVSGAAHGQLVVNADNSVTYTPTIGYLGPDSFTYTVRDNTSLTATGIVNVTVTPPTVTFQQGVNGYTGTFDTHVRDNATGTNEGGNTNALFDNAGPVSHALLRFESIFGAGAGQVPSNATIASATLRLRITNEGNGAALHRMLQTWEEDVITWDSAVGGIQRDDIEAMTTPDFTSGNMLSPSTVNTWVDFNVTSSVLAWFTNQTSNHGWAIFDTGDDGVQFGTSENTTADFQPKLTVVYTVPSNNQAPVNAVPGAISVNEDTALALSGANAISISDPDAGNATVTTTLSIPAGRGALSVNSGAIPGLTVTGSGGASITMTGPIADINTKLASLIYTPAGDVNGATVLTILTNDQGNSGQGGPLTDTDTLTIAITPINDAPTFTLTGDPPTAPFNAGAQTVPGIAIGMSAGPADEAGQGLTFNLAVGTTTGGLTFSTPPAINAATGELTYTVAPGSSGTAQINVTLQDGGSAVAPNVNVSGAQTLTITVPAINQPPVNSVPASVVASEDIRFQFTGANTISISDADAAAANVQTTVSVPAGQGTLRVDATAVAGLTVSGIDTNSILLVGPVAAINAKLATLSYLSPLDFNGATTLTVLTNDNGANGPDGPKTDSDDVAISIGAVNDAPTFTLAGNPPAATFNGGLQTVPGFATSLSAGPTDEASQILTFNLVVGATTGGLTFSTSPAIDPATGVLSYAASSGSSGTAQVSVTLQDGGNGTAPNVNTSTQTFTITVSSIVINAPPVNTAPASVTVDEDIRFTFAGANAISISDADAGVANVQTTISVPLGTGTLRVDNALVAGLIVSGIDTNRIVLTGPVSAINGKLATLSYLSPTNFNGATSLTIVTNDNGATGQDGAKSDTDSFAVTINPVNDAPLFNPLSNPPSSLTGTGVQTVSNFATGMSAGPADEAAQSLTFVLAPMNTTGGLTFSTAPSIDAVTGALTYTATPGAKGTATFSVVLQDGGLGFSPNVNISTPHTFTINVVGTAPSIVAADVAIRQAATSFTFESINPLAVDGSPITFNIDWDGDGDIDEYAEGEFSGGLATVDVLHVFPIATPTGEPLEVVVYTTDATGDSEVSTHLVDVNIFGLVTNDEGLDDLVFGGTHFADRIVVSLLSNGGIQIRNNSTYYRIPAELGEVTGRIVIWAGQGNDTVSIAGRLPYDTELHGGDGNDYLAGGLYNDILHGDAGNDRLLDSNGTNTYFGGDGNDTISGGRGDDSMFGGDGRDYMNGSLGNDTMDGGDGNDSLVGYDGDDILFGGFGNDILRGDRGNDVILGGGSNDNIQGGPGRDILIGGAGADQIYGGSDDDLLVGSDVDLGNGEDAFEFDILSLQQLMTDWLRPQPLKSTTGNSRSSNLSDRLNDLTILDDFARDTLYGQTDADWFLTYRNDVVIDLGSENLRTNLD